MSVDELRAGLARIADTVVPDPDPYTLVLRHARRRRRHRLAGLLAAVAAVLAAALAGPAALTAAGLRQPVDHSDLGHGHPIESPWSLRLLDSPPRGNLAGDAAFLSEVRRLFDRRRAEVMIAPDLPGVTVLFADESTGAREVVVAYRSATSAALVTRTGPPGASPAQLLGGDGAANLPADPFFVDSVAAGGAAETRRQLLLGLAPAGCRISLGRTAYPGDVGLRRTWQAVPTDGYAFVDVDTPGWWRVECDGQVRQAGPVSFGPDLTGAGTLDATWPRDQRPKPTPEPPNTTVTRQAALAYRSLTAQAGLVDPAPPVIRWSGRLDDAGGPAVLLGAQGKGPLLLEVGETGAGPILARATSRDPDPADPGGDLGPLPPPLVATGYPPAYDLLAVRVPARDGNRAVLTDRLLVVPRPGVTRIEAVAGGKVRASAAVTDGAALLDLPVGADVTLRGRDAAGTVRCSGPLREPATGDRVFNEPLVRDWS
ncbi:hypothetical protein [Micromonospora auratinigra]|uniref:Uncharacterized protein n=1 Tax=Micromonospora auratinigra TaxID=261654 RepID=A0A1A8ZMM2_9ACTN|nr:hypothetical protein [Micromonospora auratinigra]SBT45342.1 hypothetical protein GA0070611_2992 [Micromonospora auratinigra]